MKSVIIHCDQCKKECDPANFGVFIYNNIGLTANQEVFKQLREEHYCFDCTSKIRNYINEYEIKKDSPEENHKENN